MSKSTWKPERLSPQDSQTRSAAAAWFYALKFDKNQNLTLLLPLLKECYPEADLAFASSMVRKNGIYADIGENLLNDILELSHPQNFEILNWREAVLRVLSIDFLATLKSSSSALTEDAILRVTDLLDDKLRGTTKNACQLLSGQRTKIRKTLRILSLAGLYLLHYRPILAIEVVQDELMQLVQGDPEKTHFSDASFPFEDFIDDDKSFNTRGLFVINETTKFLRKHVTKRDELDALIQKSSKKWRIERMSVIDLNILRLAGFELFYDKASAPRILINEAVELAKIFGAEQSKNFVNGILQQLCNDNGIVVN